MGTSWRDLPWLLTSAGWLPNWRDEEIRSETATWALPMEASGGLTGDKPATGRGWGEVLGSEMGKRTMGKGWRQGCTPS